jgi:hypothetical protein
VDRELKPGIQIRANSKFRVQVRRNGIYQSKTFGSIREAEMWQRVVEGKATAEEIVEQKTAKRTTLAKACAWMIGGSILGSDSLLMQLRWMLGLTFSWESTPCSKPSDHRPWSPPALPWMAWQVTTRAW